MTHAISPRWPGRPRPERFLLATDLDGTLLAGSPEARRRVRELFAAAPGASLVFATGRGLESVLPLLSDPTVPSPDYIIADIGATIVDRELRPVGRLQQDIAARGHDVARWGADFLYAVEIACAPPDVQTMAA